MNRELEDQLLGLLLQRTPDRVIDALAAAQGEGASIAEMREALMLTALATAPIKPSDALKSRLLATRPRVKRPAHPVVLVVDMLVDHLTPGRPLEVPRSREIVPALKRHLGEWRAAKVPIFYICDSHPADDPDFADWPIHNVEGTPGAEIWPELAPAPGEVVIKKNAYSAFMGTDLAKRLEAQHADSLILTGCLTEIQLHVTAADALQRGYVVQIPPDCQAGATELAEQGALLTLSTMQPYDPIYLRREPAGAGRKSKPAGA